MAAPEFIYQDPLPIEKDTTRYRLLTKDYVLVTNFEGEEILKVDPAALILLANVAIRDVSFLLRTAHLAELGMEATWKIEVEDFPAFILVDDKGNAFFKQILQ
jgi:tartrate dehydratase beta subunit/fumarate hydratase class I family protein